MATEPSDVAADNGTLPLGIPCVLYPRSRGATLLVLTTPLRAPTGHMMPAGLIADGANLPRRLRRYRFGEYMRSYLLFDHMLTAGVPWREAVYWFGDSLRFEYCPRVAVWSAVALLFVHRGWWMLRRGKWRRWRAWM